MEYPTIDEIREAANRIRGHAHRTPVLTCRTIDERLGASVFFKCESFQRAGAFKFRGACNAVFSLPEAEAARGVLTHSSGNHGAALALAARERGIPATVVMPRKAPVVKMNAVSGYGAKVVLCEPTLASRESTAEAVMAETGATLVHPYDNRSVIAGQGTAALELLEEVPALNLVLAPVGGGGLASGTAIAVAHASPGTATIGAEPAGADDAYRSLQAGRIIPQTDPRTIADGLRTSLCPRTFAALRAHLREIVTVEEETIVAAMRLVWERMKIIIEPSSAVPLGALLSGRIETRGLRIGVIFSGGNVDLDHLPWLA